MRQPWYYTVSYFLIVLAVVIITDQIWNMNFIESAIVGIITSLAVDIVIDLHRAYKNGV